ncbi:MAG: FMN-binding protein [Candidatus Thermoplasmatota archaeon]|nr:FMN-binding protein [Candidatus Thermoplasmatota archaeon]
MREDVKKMAKNTLVLFITVFVVALLLAEVYQALIVPMEKERASMETNYFADVFPQATFNKKSISYEGKEIEYWEALEGGELVGYVGKVNTTGAQTAGSNPLIAYVALDGDLRVKKVIVPEDQLMETPGLGSRIAEESFTSRFEGLSAEEIALSSEGGSIDAITGATQSSTALTEGVRFVVEALSAEMRA